MEKSMIMDLDTMRTSMGYRNTFTTSFHDGGYELKKSKISNLPSYKKSDLSLKLPFVIVFQTMEIERLSEEIEALRVALKDSERQAFNCQSYEVQIRQLTDQCHDYDIQLGEYKEEIEKLNMISQKLYDQLEEWKLKYQNYDPLAQEKYNAKTQECCNLENEILKWKDRFKALERSKDKQLQDLKLAMESQRKSVLDRQIKQLNLKFDTERSYLQGQLKKMQQAADQRDNELMRAKYEAEALRIQIQANLDAIRKLKEADNKLNRMAEEQVRMNELLRRKQQQIERKDVDQGYLKEMIKSLEKQKMAQQNEAIKVPQLEGIIKQWVVRFSRLENENNQIRQELQRIPNMEKNLENCAIQIQRLGMIVKAKLQQVNQLNLKSQKYRALYQETKKSEQKVPSLERKITQLGYESERLNDILKKRLIQIEEGKGRILGLEKALRIFQQAEPEKKRIEEEYKKQIREIQKHKKQISELTKQASRIPQLESMIMDERTVREQYTKQVDRLNKVTKEMSDQNQTMGEKVLHLEGKVAELSNIEEELGSYKNQNNRLVQQIDNMNSKIKTKCEQLQTVVESVVNLQRNIEHYKQVELKLIQNIEQTEKLMEQLNRTKDELERSEEELLRCQAEVNEAKNMIVQINNDKQILSRNLNIKEQQLEHAKVEISDYLEQINQLREIERQHYVLQEEMRVTLHKLKEAEEVGRRTEDLLRKQTAKNQELQHRCQMLNNEIGHIHREGYFPEQFRTMYASIKGNGVEKQKQLSSLGRKQQSMQKFTDEIQGMVFNLCETMKVRNSEWSQIKDKISDSTAHVRQIQQLQDQIHELRILNIELESQMKMLQLEMSDAEGRKTNNSGSLQLQPGGTAVGTGSSWRSFNTVPSKKAIDSIVEDQASSRVSSISNNHNRVLGSSGQFNATKQKAQEKRRSSSKSGLSSMGAISSSSTSNKNLNLNVNINTTNATPPAPANKTNSSAMSSSLGTQNKVSGYTSREREYLSPSSISIRSTKGLLSSVNGLSALSASSSKYVSPAKGMTSPVTTTATTDTKTVVRQSSESYYAMKTSKASSVRDPFTFKTSTTSYRA